MITSLHIKRSCMKKKTSLLSVLAISVSLVLGWFYYGHIGSSVSIPSTINKVENNEIVASAIIDSLNDIIRVTTLQATTVKHLKVRVGDKVKRGELLFALDDTFPKISVRIYKAALEQARNNLLMQQRISNHLKIQLKRLKSLEKGAVSRVELREKLHEFNMSIMQIKQAEESLELSTANLKNAEMILSQYSIAAPRDGIVLQINTHVGEFLGGGIPAIFLGDAKKVMVRVSIDERDIYEFNPRAPAFLTTIEPSELKIPLQFVELNRYIVTQERLNSRVQEVLYSFNRDQYSHLVAGQQFEAHILVEKRA